MRGGEYQNGETAEVYCTNSVCVFNPLVCFVYSLSLDNIGTFSYDFANSSPTM